MTDIQAIKARHRNLTLQLNERSTGMMYHEGCIAHTDRATLLSALTAAEARAEAAEALIRVLLENDPNELAADGGITVLDVWRKDAARTLKGAPDGR